MTKLERLYGGTQRLGQPEGGVDETVHNGIQIKYHKIANTECETGSTFDAFSALSEDDDFDETDTLPVYKPH